MFRVRLILVCLTSVILYGCTYERQYFKVEELDSYNSPIIFLKAEDTGKNYFISLADAEDTYYFDYECIEDFRPEKQTFLFTQKVEGTEYIGEYDLTQKEYKHLLDENVVQEYLGITDDEEFKSVYYYPEEGKISFLYGTYLVIYEVQGECKLKLELPIDQVTKVYDWLNSDELLLVDFRTAYTVNINSGERQEIDSVLGNRLILSSDRTMGSGYGDENWFGAGFSPVLVWDTQDYTVKRFHESCLSAARTQLSHDNQYVMFGQCMDKNQVLCMNTEDESICVMYETKDWIVDILWE